MRWGMLTKVIVVIIDISKVEIPQTLSTHSGTCQSLSISMGEELKRKKKYYIKIVGY